MMTKAHKSKARHDEAKLFEACNEATIKPAISIKKDHAILDTGATSIFIMKGAPVKNIQVAQNPISINMPEGAIAKSTHTCDLDIPDLPPEATRGHIVPELAHASLIGIRVLCKAGCKVIFDWNKRS